MSFITTLLGKTEQPATHADLLFDKRIRGVFGGMMTWKGEWVPRSKCYRKGRSTFVRPRDISSFLYYCKRAGIDTHPMAQELNLRFAKDPGFYLEFRHDAKNSPV